MNVPETFFTVREQLFLFGLSCLFGVLLGVVYDFFRTFRIIVPHNFWLVLIEDILFLVIYSVFLSTFAAAAARGEMRLYYVAGNLLGFILYIFTVGSAVICTIKKLLSILKHMFTFILRPLRSVYVFLCKKAALKFVGSSKVFAKSLKKSKNLLLKYVHLSYNNKENKKRKNVKNVAKKSKTKEKKRSV